MIDKRCVKGQIQERKWDFDGQILVVCRILLESKCYVARGGNNSGVLRIGSVPEIESIFCLIGDRQFGRQSITGALW